MAVVLSGYLDSDKNLNKCVRVRLSNFPNQLNQDVIEELTVTSEEADKRVIPYFQYAVSKGYQDIVVASNDMDVVILILSYTLFHIRQGLKKLYAL